MENILTVLHEDRTCKARTGILHLPHGDVETPAFMPVGTNATVKGIYHCDVEAIGYRLILGNTYHLYLRPGTDVIGEFGGIGGFSNWHHNILTDSGGFQAFSLSKLRKVREEGITFQSHIDGSRHFFSPEKVVDIQNVFRSDIAMCLDLCTEPGLSYKKSVEAMDRTHRWAERSVEERNRLEDFRGNLFGIIQGNFYEDLRKISARAISDMDFSGIAIGGLSVGEEPEVFKQMLAVTADAITAREKPRYVMGIGTPEYILEAIENGIDMFDCVLQTRTARNGTAFTDDGMLNLNRSFNEHDHRPIQEGCRCRACRDYSRAYIRHLFKAGEMFGGMLVTEHNLTYFYDLIEKARKAISEDRFPAFKKEYLERFNQAKSQRNQST